MPWPFTNKEFDGEMVALRQRAEALARSFLHDYIGVEHYFLCLRDLAPGHAVLKLLSATQIDLAKFWLELEREAKIVTGRPIPASLPLTPRATKVMELAAQFARLDRMPAIGLMHFLFAVAHERGNLPAVLFARQFTSQFPQYDGYSLLASQFIGFACFAQRGYLAFQHPPEGSA
jgi:hypothetical protein